MTEATSLEEVARQQIEQRTAIDLDSKSLDELANIDESMRYQLQERKRVLQERLENLKRTEREAPASEYGEQTRKLLESVGVSPDTIVSCSFGKGHYGRDFDLTWDSKETEIGRLRFWPFSHEGLLNLNAYSGSADEFRSRGVYTPGMPEGNDSPFRRNHPKEYERGKRIVDLFYNQSPLRKLQVIEETANFLEKVSVRAVAPAPAAGPE